MLVKVKLEEFKSVDQNYQGGEKYHKGEKVYFGNPDSEYHGAYGKFQEIEKRDYPDEDICIVEITSPLRKIMTFREAAEKYDIDSSTLRHAKLDNRFREGEIRKSGGTWLVTREAMERLYGKGEKMKKFQTYEKEILAGTDKGVVKLALESGLFSIKSLEKGGLDEWI